MVLAAFGAVCCRKRPIQDCDNGVSSRSAMFGQFRFVLIRRVVIRGQGRQGDGATSPSSIYVPSRASTHNAIAVTVNDVGQEWERRGWGAGHEHVTVSKHGT